MRSDIYTKAILTVIAVMLTAIACSQYVSPITTASAQSAQFAGVQALSETSFFDTRTGELFAYEFPRSSFGSDGYVHDGAKAMIVRKYRLSRLGEPIILEHSQMDHISK